MRGQSERRMVIDAKKAWSNLPYALMPASVGLCLIAFPWVGSLDPGMTAPIMLPFGCVWLVIGACINHYHSELILDKDTNEVIYRSSLILHSWDNRVAQGNVKRVLLTQESSKYRFVMEVEEGEDLSVTTFDYWRSREWSEQVAHFLQVPLVDECRDGDEVSPDELVHSIKDDARLGEFDLEPPGKIGLEWHNERRASITIPARGILRSSRLRLVLGGLCLLGGVAGFFLLPGVRWLMLALAAVLTPWLWARPFAQATHHEEMEISPNGLLVTLTTYGRSTRKSIPVREIRQITVVKGEDARFERADFDHHAVCIEGLDHHLQLGANLPKLEQVEWLQQALLYVLTRGKPAT
jgi:hypothetical protein